MVADEGLRVAMFGVSSFAVHLLRGLLAQGRHRPVMLCTMLSKSSPMQLAKIRTAEALMSWGFYPRECFALPIVRPSPSLEALARKAGCQILSEDRIRSPEFVSRLSELNPDIGIVAGFPRLIPTEVCNVPRLGIFNLHPSLLPKHRGGTPSRWAIRDGDTESGVTAHILDSSFDTGPIVGQRSILIAPMVTAGELDERLAEQATTLALDVLDSAASGHLRPIPQDAMLATSEPPFHGAYQWIDWSEPSHVIARTCDAMRPRSGGLARTSQHVYCLYETSAVADPAVGAPGDLIGFDERGFPIIACGAGRLYIESVIVRGRVVSASRIFARRKFAQGPFFNVRFEGR